MNGLFLLAAEESVKADWLTKALTCYTFWALAFGSIALWLLVPGGGTQRWPRILGGVLACVSSVLFALDLPLLGQDQWGPQIMFWILAFTTLGAGVAMISARSPVYSALYFALSLFGTAGLFLMQGAQFLGVVTVVVYAGAIVVTFLFVIMLSGSAENAPYDRISWGWFPIPASVLTAAVLLGLLAGSLSGLKTQAGTATTTAEQVAKLNQNILSSDHMAHLGQELFSSHLVAVEIVGALLMAALVGAVAIAMHGKAARPAGEEHA